MRLSLKTAPAALPLDWATEIKGHLRVDTDDEQARVQTVLVPAAVDWLDSLTNRQLITATWTVLLDAFPSSGLIVLPKPPLQSVTHVKYVDGNGATQTWDAANYSVSKPSGPKCARGRIIPAYGVSYPTTQDIEEAVEIEIVTGYGAAFGSVPAGLRQALLLLIGEMFERREESVTGTIVSPVALRALDLALGFLSEG